MFFSYLGNSITLRAGLGFFIAFFLLFFTAPTFIRWLKSFQKNGQPLRSFGPSSHLETKAGTPTMGGFLIIISTTVSILLMGNLNNLYLWLLLFMFVSFGSVGMVDDLKKLRKNTFHGIRPRIKFLLQVFFASLFVYGYYLTTDPLHANGISFLLLKDYLFHNTILHVVLAVCVVVSFSNAVNLTDGLDGLASFPSIIAFITLGAIAYMSGHIGFAEYIQLPYLKGAGEVIVCVAAISGALLAFLWYNALPAQVFMGDTGSLAIGAAMGGLAIIVKQEFLSALIGIVFFSETLSVIIQVSYFRYTGGKRIFKMTPLHHHFEQIGWSEATIVKRFWIVALLFSILSLLTLKVRL